MTDIISILRARADSYRLGGPSSEHTASLLEEAAFMIEQLCDVLRPFSEAGGQLPETHGPDNEPIEVDEPVSIYCCGFGLGDVSAGDMHRAWRTYSAMVPHLQNSSEERSA